MTVRQYVTFLLGGEQFGVEVSKTREILDLVPVTKVPQTPDYLIGVINLRGQVVPVVDLRVKFNMNPEEGRDRCIIVVEVSAGEELLTVGILSDAVREVQDLHNDQIEPAPRLGLRLNTGYLQGMGKIGEQFVMLLDIDRVLNDEELSAVLGDGEAEFA